MPLAQIRDIKAGFRFSWNTSADNISVFVSSAMNYDVQEGSRTRDVGMGTQTTSWYLLGNVLRPDRA